MHELGVVQQWWENAGGQTYTPQVATSTASRCHWFTIESGLHPTPSRCLVRRILPIEKNSLFFCWPCPQNKNTGINTLLFVGKYLREWHCHFCLSMVSFQTVWTSDNPFKARRAFLSGWCCSCFCSFRQICHVRWQTELNHRYQKWVIMCTFFCRVFVLCCRMLSY